MTSEELKALATKDKEGARNLVKYLRSQLSAEPEPKKEAPKDPPPPKEGHAPPPKEEADAEAEPVTGKTDPGLFNIIPKTFNVTDNNGPLIISIQDQEGESLLTRHDLDFEEYCNVKQSYLAVVMKEEQNDKIGKQVITIKPGFAVLNHLTLTLFENENVKNMYKVFELKYLK